MNTAIQLWDGELSVITTPPPRVSVPTDVVIKVAYSGICGTDLHVLAKEFPTAKSVVLGHEFSGVVTEIGSEVKHCSVGERSGENIYLHCYFVYTCFCVAASPPETMLKINIAGVGVVLELF
jgi:threonine dehydrogenase-like Zn-dependent dehydrogenase